MTRVTAGSRLVLRFEQGRAGLRALDDVALEGEWRLPVIGSVEMLSAATGVLELTVDGGLVEVEAHLEVSEGALVLRPGEGAAPVVHQRREDVRGPVCLPLRAAALSGVERAAAEQNIWTGSTLSLSAGGLSARLDGVAGGLRAGAHVFVELELPDGRIAPAVSAVVSHRSGCLRTRFVDIAEGDRERLVHLVFAEQRRLLALRRC